MHRFEASPARIALGFEDAATAAFSFLQAFGYRLVEKSPTYVRFECGSRYINVFHGRGCYALGIEFGVNGKHSEEYSLKEVVNAVHGDGAYRELTPTSKAAVARGLEKLADDVRALDEVLVGKIPVDRIQSYRQRLTDYYSGKSTRSPDRGKLP